MKISKTIALLSLAITALFTAVNMQAKDKLGLEKRTLYVYGFSASFNDSTVYFTDIQQLEGWVSSKGKFLSDRMLYANQLRDYFTAKSQPNRTCIIAFALSRKDIEKKYMKLMHKYDKNGKYNIKYVSANDFQFKAITPLAIEEQAQETSESKK